MVIFVIGLPCSGKSTFIQNNFSDFYKIDLFDYQENIPRTVEGVWTSYENCKDALIEALLNHENIVFEHTLFKAIRREYYIQAIQAVKKTDMVIYLINPSTSRILKNAKKRNVLMSRDEIEQSKKILEIPNKKEGFKEIHIIKD